jgi:uncharacterized protein (DUF58 family)
MIADHELDVWLVLDTSSSLDFGTGRASKHQLAWSAAGAFALLAARNGNRVGGVRSAPAKPRPSLMPARGGSAHVAGLLTMLLRDPPPSEEGDLGRAMEAVSRSAKRRGLVVVLSDFLGPPSWERPMRALAHRHEVIAVEVFDRREVELPDVGLIAVVDAESGRRRLVDTSDSLVRAKYAASGTKRRQAVAARLKGSGVDHLALRTDRDWVLDFVGFVARRKTRLMTARKAG